MLIMLVEYLWINCSLKQVLDLCVNPDQCALPACLVTSWKKEGEVPDWSTFFGKAIVRKEKLGHSV